MSAAGKAAPENGGHQHAISASAYRQKYDYVKIKVWLGENLDHYYILSRFLISRTLTVTKVPQDKAVKIALEVKKWLVDNDKLDTSQEELEAVLFSSMRARGFGDEYVQRFRMMNRFQQQKRPLIIMLCGSARTGKSTLAQQLASRLNLPNVLQTDMLYQLLQGGLAGEGKVSDTPLWAREHASPQALVSDFQQECRLMRRALDGDLLKCIQDGKSIIIEGLHIDPSLYLYEFGRGGLLDRMTEHQEQQEMQRSRAVEEHEAVQRSAGRLAYSSTPRRWSQPESGGRSAAIAAASSFMLRNGSSAGPRAAPGSLGTLPSGGGAAAGGVDAGASRAAALQAGLMAHGGPVFVPMVVTVEEEGHRDLAQPWMTVNLQRGGIGSELGGPEVAQLVQRAFGQLRELQHYLDSYAAAGVPVIPMGLEASEEALDAMHDYVLGCIQAAMEQADHRRQEQAVAAGSAGARQAGGDDAGSLLHSSSHP